MDNGGGLGQGITGNHAAAMEICKKYGQDQRLYWRIDDIGAFSGDLEEQFMIKIESLVRDCVVFDFIASFSRGIASLFFYLRLLQP
ncbi:hypothetical protein AM506_18840 [Rossellomorea vietnamensis]|uniref:Uncharacterized protein n=2 Tax=Rossellomorea vietnamensis TaxID=218284 RepID=A0A0N8GGC3_9BACI|nr:hypothetical protein AM506_18840 [Rossellomorea vietnamensis]